MRDWYCRTFHRLGHPIRDSFRCLDCGRSIPIRTGLADILIRENLRGRLAVDASREVAKDLEFSAWWKKEIGQ